AGVGTGQERELACRRMAKADDLATEFDVRIGVDADLDGSADPDPSKVGFLHVRVHPDGVRIVINEQPRSRRDIFAGFNEGAVHPAIEFGAVSPPRDVDLLSCAFRAKSRFLRLETCNL